MSGSIRCWHCIEVKYVINATSSSTNITSCGNGPRGDRTNAQERFGNHPYKLSRLQENNNEKEPCKTSHYAVSLGFWLPK